MANKLSKEKGKINRIKYISIAFAFLMIISGFLILFNNSSPSKNLYVNNIPSVSQNIDYTTIYEHNISLPDYVDNYQVVATKYSPVHNLVIYYPTTTGYLAYYDTLNNTLVNLHTWNGIGDNYNEYTDSIFPYQLLNGSIEYITQLTYINTYFWIEYYNLYNGSYQYFNTSISYATGNALSPIPFNSTTYVVETNYLYAFNYFNHSLEAKIGTDSTLTQWNTYNLIFGTDMFATLQNTYGNNTANLQITTLKDNVFTFYNFYAYNSQINGVQSHDEPFYTKYQSNGNLSFYGIAATSNSGTVNWYIVNFTVSYPLYSLSSASFSAISTPYGDTDYFSYNIFDQNYTLNGENVYSSTYNLQSGFVNVFNGTELYASNSNATWLNTYFQNNLIGFGTAGTSMNAFGIYYGFTGYENGFIQQNTNNFELYYLPQYEKSWITSLHTLYIPSYTLTIKENGLPNGTLWNFKIDNTNYSLSSNTMNLTLPKNNYTFFVYKVSDYNAVYNLTINLISDYTEYVNFSVSISPYYQLKIKEIGLPNFTLWNFNLNGLNYELDNTSYNFSLQNGTYNFYVNIVSHYSVIYNSPIIINGNTTYENITFVYEKITYNFTLIEYGLPHNTNWFIIFDNQYYNSTNNIIIISNLPNGEYSFTVEDLNNFSASYNSIFVIDNKNQTNFVEFTPIQNNIPFYNMILKYLPELLIGLFIMGLLVVGAVSRRR